eukprot:gene6370-10377_t
MTSISFGINNNYQCGHSFSTMINEPIPSNTLKDFSIKKMSCGEDHTLFQTDDGRLYGLGSNAFFQLNDGNGSGLSKLHELHDFKDKIVTNFSAGYVHSIVVTDSKDIWVFGNNAFFQLGVVQTTVSNPLKLDLDFIESVKQLECKAYYSAIVTKDGKLFISGRLQYYQQEYFRWNQFLKEEKIISISAGGDFLYAINEKNEIFGIGSNDVHQLPGIEEKELYEFKKLESLCNLEITKISSGIHHSVAMTKFGVCYGVGWNKMYNLGLNHRDTIQKPVLLKDIPLVRDVATSENASVFITNKGIYYCGIMETFRMPNATLPKQILKNEKINQISCGNHYFIGFFSNEFELLYEEKMSTTLKTNIKNCSKFLDLSKLLGKDGDLKKASLLPINSDSYKAISTTKIFSSAVTFLLKSNGDLYVSGSNSGNNMALPGLYGSIIKSPIKTTLSGIIDVSTGDTHSLAMSKTAVFAFGFNNVGQCGDGTPSLPHVTPVQSLVYNITAISAGKSFSLALDKNGDVFGFGNSINGQFGMTGLFSTPTKISLSNIKQISAGFDHSLFLDAFGNLYASGVNTKGQLGNGNTDTQNTPQLITSLQNVTKLSAGYKYSLVLVSGKVYGFGDNTNGQLGFFYTPLATSTPVLISQLNGIKGISAGFSHSLVFNSSDTLAFGSNTNGKLGDGTETNSYIPRYVLGAPKEILDVQTGYAHSLLLGKYGDVYSFGKDSNGEIGRSSINRLTNPKTFVSMSFGTAHTLAMNKSGSIFSWGLNAYGQLGDGTVDQKNTPQLLSGISGSIKQVEAGWATSFILRDDGKFYSFGFNVAGQLSLGHTTTPMTSPGLVTRPFIVQKISASLYTTAYLGSDGNVYTAGGNNFGALGIGNTQTNFAITTSIQVPGLSNIVDISAGLYHFLTINSNGDVFGFGSNAAGQLGNGTTGNYFISPIPILNADKISAGEQSSHVVSNQHVYSFGSGTSLPTLVSTLEGKNITHVAGSQVNAIFYSNVTKKLYATGDNSFGQLTTDNFNPVTSPIELNYGKNVTLQKLIQTRYTKTILLEVDYSCFGINADNSTACSSRGTCSGQDKCTCDVSFAGDECEIDLSTSCFRKGFNDPTVCSGQGVCSSYNNCTCKTEYYGEECEHNYFLDMLNSICVDSCTLNKTEFTQCTLVDDSNCCNHNFADSNINIVCDASSNMLSISLVNKQISGVLPKLNLKSLQNLDLSMNSIKINQRLDSLLPLSIKTINFTGNNIEKVASFFDVSSVVFSNLLSLDLDDNGLCGFYGYNWNSYNASLIGNSKTLYCSSISNICSPADQLKSKQTFLPYENSTFIKLNTSNCPSFGVAPNLQFICESRNILNNQILERFNASSFDQQKGFECKREGFGSQEEKFLSLSVQYSSSHYEIVSKPVNLTQLPYLNEISIDRTVIYSNNTLESQIVNIGIDRNLNQYKRNDDEIFRCRILPDDYFVDVVNNGNSFACPIVLNSPNGAQKTISLYENTSTHLVAQNSLSFWLTDIIFLPNIALFKNFNEFRLNNSAGVAITAISNLDYFLSVDGVISTCTTNGNSINSCLTQPIQSDTDISILKIDYKDSNVTIGTFPILFYKKNTINYVYPQEIIANQLTDVYLTFNESTLNTTMTENRYVCDIDGMKFNGEIFNVTTLKCINVTAGSTKKLSIIISGENPSFGEFFINDNEFYLYSIGNDMIYKESSNFLYSSQMNRFNFSFGQSVPDELTTSFECHFDDSTVFMATSITQKQYFCDVDSINHQNMTVYFRTREGLKIKFSSNSLFLAFIRFGLTHYNPASKQIGNTLINHQIVLDVGFDVDPIVKRLFLGFKNSYIAAEKFSAQNLKFQIASDIPTVQNISLLMKLTKFHKVNDINGIFESKIDLTLNGNLNIGDRVIVSIPTSKYINSGILQSNCLDIVLIHKTLSIGRQISNCNSNSTGILFNIQETFNGSDTNYKVYLGNSDFNNPNTTVDGSSDKDASPTIVQEVTTSKLISNSTLQFVFIEKLNISRINPQLSLIPQSLVQIYTNYQDHYENLINYEIQLNGTGFSSSYENFFNSSITAIKTSALGISVHAVLKNSIQSTEITNTETFYFLEKIKLNYLTPFYDTFDYYGETKHLNITVIADAELLTDLSLYCKINCSNQISYAKAKRIESDHKKVSCSLNTHQLNQNVEYCFVGLWVNGSTDPSQNFDLSSNQIPYVVVKQPIDYQNISQVLFLKDQGEAFSLNLTTLNLTNNQYSVQMIAEKSGNPNMNVVCDFNLKKPFCQVPTLSLSHIPMKLDSKLKINFKDYNLNSTISINSFYFRDNITYVTEYPFISNPMNTTDFITVNFNVSQKLNPSYEFYCGVFDQKYSAVVNSGDNHFFSCSFPPRGIEEIASISLYINNTKISELGGLISNQDSNVELLSLRFDPPYVEMTDSQIFSFKKNSSNFLTIPDKYTNLKYKIFSDSGSSDYPCVLNGSNITCNKSSIITGTSYDIGILGYHLKTTENSVFQTLIKIEHGLFLYKKNLISEIRPLATLVNTDVNVTLNFQVSTLNIQLDDAYHLYCQHSDGKKWIGHNIDNQQLRCFVEYNQHNLTVLNITSFINAPTYTSDDLYIAKNEYPFYYLNQGVIKFTQGENATKFFYTSTLSNVLVNITNYIPTKVLKYVTCKLSDSSGFALSSGLISSEGNKHEFNCTFLTSSPGLKQLTLWYHDEEGYQFQFSSNSIELVFAEIAAITGMNPPAIRSNSSSLITVFTTFQISLDYGSNVTFSCKYGETNDRFKFISNASIDTSFTNAFSCSIYSSVDAQIYISLWMTAKNIERKITLTEDFIRAVSDYFFTPNHGTPAGGELLTVEDYKEATALNITFSNYLDFIFDCSKSGTNLNCKTPLVEGIPLFSSQTVNFTNGRSLASTFILYESVSITDFHPKVVSSNYPTVGVNVKMNKKINIQTGQLFLVLESLTVDDVRHGVGLLTNSSNFNVTITRLSPGIKRMEIFYYNEESFAFRSMFAIAPQVNLTFLGSSIISYSSDSNNLAYIGESQNVTVKIQTSVALTEEKKEFVKCKVGTKYLPTYYSSNDEFICTLFSNTASLEDLSLYYNNSDALNSEILISSNTLDVFYVEKITTASVVPFASLSNKQNISISSNFVNIFGSKVEFYCVWSTSSYLANFQNNKFDCEIERTNDYDYRNVTLKIMSKLTGKSVIFNEIPSTIFYFIKPFTSNAISPIGYKFNTTSSLSNLTISITLNKEIPIFNGLSCVYTSSEGRFISKASEGSTKSTVKCDIHKTNLNLAIESMDITLQMNASGSDILNLSSNNQSFVFIKEALELDFKKIINATDIDSFIPVKVSLPKELIYNVSMTPVQDVYRRSFLNCNFINQKLSCKLNQSELDLLYSFPSELNFKLDMTHPYSGELFSVKLTSLIYYQNLKLEHAKPFIIGHNEHKYIPARIVFTTVENLNWKRFTYSCQISQNGNNVQSISKFDDSLQSELQLNTNNQSQFSCAFTTFGSSNSQYNITLSFNYEGVSYLLTSVPAVVQVLDTIQLPITSSRSYGGVAVEINIPLIYPTNLFSDYDFSLKLERDSKYLDMNSCGLTGNTVKCSTPSVKALYSDWRSPKKFRVSLFINNMKSMTLSPFMEFYGNFDFSKISPSKLLKLGHNYTMIADISNPVDESKLQIKYLNSQGDFEYVNSEFISSNQISFASPTFQTLGLVDIGIFRDNQFYQLFSKSIGLFNESDIQVYEISPTLVTKIEKTTFSIFYNFSSMIDYEIKDQVVHVKFSDQSISFISIGFANNSFIEVEFTPFQFNAELPRVLDLYLSFDGGINFKKFNQKLKLDLTKLTFTPFGFPKGFAPRVTFDSTQNLNNLRIGLNSNASMICSANICQDSQFDYETSSSGYDLQFYEVVNNVIQKINLPVAKKLVIYDVPIATPQAKLIYRNSTFPLNILIPNTNLKLFSFKVYAEFTTTIFSTKQTFGTITVNSNSIDVVFSDFSSVANGATNGKLYISYNDGYSYHLLVSDMTLIDDFTFSSIKNAGSNENGAYTFQQTKLTLLGKKFSTINGIKVQISNDLFSQVLTDVTFKSETEIDVVFPRRDQISIPFSVSYPITLKLGLSMDNGAHYQLKDLVYSDQIKVLLVYAISPDIIHPKPRNLDVQGVGFEFVTDCLFYHNNTLIHKTKKQNGTDESTRLICDLNIANLQDYKELELKLFTQFNTTSSGKSIFILPEPTVSSVYPLNGTTQGGFEVIIKGSFSNTPIYAKFDLLPSPSCTFTNQNEVKCISPSHSTGASNISISYNNVDLFYSPDMFQFIPCSIGFGASNYSAPCVACPPGTYKNSPGIYDCVSCEIGFYSNQFKSTLCSKCSKTTTSIDIGLKNDTECVCDVGYLNNPYSSGDKCLPCPKGAICSQKNLSLPIAQKGYWYTNSDITTFYACSPSIACPGGLAENCTNGYDGARCGFCNSGYYKSKLYCYPCQEYSILKLALVVLFDFLEPECILPQLRYIHIYLMQVSLPFAFLACFIFLYIVMIVRSFLAGCIGGRVIKKLRIRYKTPIEIDSDEEEEEEDWKKRLLKKLKLTISNGLTYARNSVIWTFKEKSTKEDFRKLFTLFLEQAIEEQIMKESTPKNDYKFNFNFTKESSSEEDKTSSMNLIFENLFSVRRFNKKMKLLKRKKDKAKAGVVTTVQIMKEMKDSFYIKDDQSDGNETPRTRRASIKNFSQSFRKLSLGPQSPGPGSKMRNPSLRTMTLTKSIFDDDKKSSFDFVDDRKLSNDDMFDLETMNQIDKIKRLKRVGSVKKLKNEKKPGTGKNDYDQVLSESFSSDTSSPNLNSKENLLSPTSQESSPTLSKLINISNATSAPNVKTTEKKTTNEDAGLFGRMIETNADVVQIEDNLSSSGNNSPFPSETNSADVKSPMPEEEK